MISKDELEHLESRNIDGKVFQKSLINMVGIPSIFFVLTIVFTHFQFEYRENNRNHRSELIQLKLDVSEYLRRFVDMESGLRGYIITKNSKFLEPYFEAQVKTGVIKQTIYKFMVNNQGLQKKFQDLVRATDNWDIKYAQPVADFENNQFEITDRFRLNAKKAFDKIRREFLQLNNDIDLISVKLEERTRYANSVNYLLEIILIFAFVIFMYFLLRKQFRLLVDNYRDIVLKNQKQMAKLIEVSKSKDLFLANMSHEIRTPLGAILGFVDLALEDKSVTLETRGHLSFVKRNGAHLLSLIEDLFDLSKVTTNKIDIVPENTDILQTLLDVKDNFSSTANDNSLVIKFLIHRKIPRILFLDPLRLRQILLNLLSNAIKFTKMNGSVTVTVSCKSDQLMFDINDEGIGIPKDKQALIFNTFHQVENAHSRKYGGAGLGLSISRTFANLMGGNLELVESKLGVGSHFRLTLPIIAAETDNFFEQEGFDSEEIPREISNPGDEESDLIEPKRLLDKKILLAEDSRENQILFQIYLQNEGADIEIVDSGADAVRKALNMNYDIILMDIQMPGIDGYEALKLLRDSGYLGKIMALTAHAMKGERERCLNAGFDDYLSKPVNKSKLIEKIVGLV